MPLGKFTLPELMQVSQIVLFGASAWDEVREDTGSEVGPILCAQGYWVLHYMMVLLLNAWQV